MGVMRVVRWRGQEGLHGDQAAQMKRKGRLARSWAHKALAEAADPSDIHQVPEGKRSVKGHDWLHDDYVLLVHSQGSTFIDYYRILPCMMCTHVSVRFIHRIITPMLCNHHTYV